MCVKRMQKTRSAVRIEGTLSLFFENKTGLKQCNPLLPILFNLALQKVIQSIKMVPSGIKIGISICRRHCINWKKWNRNKTTFCWNGKHCQKVRTTDKPRKDRIYMIVER